MKSRLTRGKNARKGTDTSSLEARFACVSPFFAQCWAISSSWGKGGIEVEVVGVLSDSLVLVEGVYLLHVLVGDGEVEEVGIFKDAVWLGRFWDRDDFVLQIPPEDNLGGCFLVFVINGNCPRL